MNQSEKTPAFREYAPIRALRTSDRVARAIRQTILDGQIAPGETLPPERTLAEQFRVTRNTVRDALRQLEGLRLVAIRQGSGAVAQDFRREGGLELLVHFLEEGTAGDHPRLLADIARARAVLGEAMIHACIDTFDLQALPALQAATEAFEAAAAKHPPRVRDLQTLEITLHRTLVAGGGNLAFELLYNSLHFVYQRLLPLFSWVVDDAPTLAALYRKATDALARDDRPAARAVYTEVFARLPFTPSGPSAAARPRS